MSPNQSNTILKIIGCGNVFKNLQVDLNNYALHYGSIDFVEIDNVSSIALNAGSILSDLTPEREDLFLAVDDNALNYARLELYGPAKLRGFRCASMLHKSTYLGTASTVGENSWIGPNVFIANRSKIAANAFVSPCSTIGDDTQVGPHVWIGKNCTIGDRVSIGQNCIIGDLVHIASKVQVGRNSILARPGLISHDVKSGTFHEAIYENSGYMIGRNFSFSKRAGSK